MYLKSIRVVILFVCCTLSALSVADPVRVFVSIIPQKTFVEKVGGDHVIVEAMVKEGSSPALYEPTPQQMQRLSKADIYITTGVPFESAWMKAIISANPDMTIVDGLKGLELQVMEAHHHEAEGKEEEHQHEEEKGHHHAKSLDPHVWASPVLVQHMLETIRDALIAADASHEEAYNNGYADYNDAMISLDSDIRAALEGATSKKFMTFHPAWGYFAATYGLTQVAVEQQGKEPGTQAVQGLIDEAKEENIQVLFIQPQFSKKLARIIGKAAQVEVVEVDALAANYEENMRALAGHLQRALVH